LQNPSVLHEAAPMSAHPPCGSTSPLATFEQVPREFASAHDLHVPVQAVSQQTPCSQFAERHSLSAPQATPRALRPHDPLVQTAGEAQSAAEVQAARQTPVPHRYGKHEVWAGVTHIPDPLQVEVPVNIVVPAAQVESAHAVPLAYSWQAPASHRPFRPQLAAPWSVQIPAGSTVPVATMVQVPWLPLSAQLRQAPLQALSQQNPWAQNPLRHSLPSVQEAPRSLRPHEFIRQVFGVRHWVSWAHVSKQRDPLQTYGRQGRESGATHWPVALQVEGGV
jgi:hypothetical protein